MRNRRILLVDNDADVSNVVHAILAKAGYEVVAAANGEDGLRCVGEGGTVDAMILDLRMPGLDGFEVLRRLERLGAAPRVLVLSGFLDDVDRDRLEESPLVAGILRKPFDVLELQEKVAAAVAVEPATGGGLPFGPTAE